MPVAEVRFLVPDELRMLSAACKAIGDGGVMRKEFVKQMRVPVKRAADDVKSTVRSLPVSARATWNVGGSGAAARVAYNYSKGGYRSTRSASRRSGLRDGIARGVRTSVHTSGPTQGLRVLIDPKTLPPDQRSLPYHMDQPGGWRHPLFGNRSKWVQQQGKPYFRTTLESHSDEYRAAITKVADEIARRLRLS